MKQRTAARTARRVLHIGWCVVAVYVVALVCFGGDGHVVVNAALSFLSQILPAVACCIAALGARGRRSEALLVAAGVAAYAVGNVLLTVVGTGREYVPFPDPSDPAYLLFYPAVIAALIMGMRREHRQSRTSVGWDTAVGTLGSATLLTVLLRPVFDQFDGNALQMVVAVAYPFCDTMLIAALLAIACRHDGRLPRQWLPLIAGLAVFTVADVAYALRVSSAGYEVETPLDAMWSVGLALVSTWAVDQARGRLTRPEAPRVRNAAALVVPALASVAALAVLGAASRGMMPDLAVVLAVVTGLAAIGRTQVAFRQLRRMAELARQARTDDLTGLPNRRAFYDLAARRLAQRPAAVALLLIDLDGFKRVNDALGHHVGDRLLVEVGERLSLRLRQGDVLARVGGDQFAVIAEVPGEAAAAQLAQKVRSALAMPFDLEGIAVQIDASVGIALGRRRGDDIHLLLRRADVAMYEAKATGQGQCLSTSDEVDRGGDRLRLIEQLREALTDGQLVLHYQPKVDLGHGGLHGVEALVRWAHPARGLLYPDAFLQVATDAGLMAELTETVLREALDQAGRWRADGHNLTVAVNLSARSLHDTQLPQKIAELLGARGLPGRALQVEITEDALMTDRLRATAVLSALRDIGVQVAIDDFGTGYSSLAYLRDLPVDELKLDRSFVAPITTQRRAAALVASTIHLAHSLGLRMVAEGVEDDETSAVLRRHGCDQAQGYLICRPLPADQITAWLPAARPRPASSTPAATAR
jgi:diguanylate cyclase (GGDEF)-like protein